MVLHGGNMHGIMCKHGGVSLQMHGQQDLQIICTYSQNSYLRHVKNKMKILSNCLENHLADNEIKFYLRYISSNEISVMLLY